MATRNPEVSRTAVVGICDSAGNLHGHGLLVGVTGISAVLTCHHVIAALQRDNLRVILRSKLGEVEPTPVLATFDAERSSPDRDAVVLRLQIEAPSVNPVLQHLDGRFYGGDLPKKVVGFSHNQAGTFAGSLGAAIPLVRLPVKPTSVLRLPFRREPDGHPGAPADFYEFAYAFPLHEPTDARVGLSGAPVFYEDGVIGLIHFTRKETADYQRESYVVPISVWANKWPELDRLIEPFTDIRLRARATVKFASAVHAGDDLAIAGYVDAAYVARAVDAEAQRMIGRPDNTATVMVVGKPKSGKTRLAFNLLSSFPDDLVVIPKTASPPDEWERSSFHDRRVSLLLDDLHAKPSWDPMAWIMAVRSAGARRCHTIVTARDGEDLAQLVLAHGPFFESVGGDRTIVHTSGGDSDFTAAEAKKLADLLGLAEPEVQKRFDGTPGSLALDLSAMRQRYIRLRDRTIGKVAQCRLLDSAKLLRHAFVPTLRTDMLRWVCETVRGSRPLSEEEWDGLKRHTIEEGFGRFDDDERFDIYTPYLDECVGYAPSGRDIQALVPFLLDQGETVLPVAQALFFRHKDFEAGRALLENALTRGVKNGKRDLAIFLHMRSANDETTAKLLREAIVESDGEDVELLEFMLGSCLVSRKGTEAECEGLLKKSQGRFPQAYHNLATLYQRLPGRARDAEQAFRDGIAVAEDSGLRFLFNDFGVFLSSQKRYEDASEAFRRGCAIGDRLACRNLSRSHLTTGTPIADPETVLQWFEQCAPGEDLEMLGSLIALAPPALAKRAYLGASKEAVFPLDVLLSGVDSIERLREIVAQGSPALSARAYISAIARGRPEALMPLAVLLCATGAVEQLAEVVLSHLSRVPGDLLRSMANSIFTLPPGAELFRLLPGKEGKELRERFRREGHELPDQERLWPAAEIFLRAAIQLGDRASCLRLGLLLAQDPSRTVEAEAVYRDVIAAGSGEAYAALGHLIAQNKARWSEAETIYREGIKRNDKGAYRGLFIILSQTSGRGDDANHLAEEMVRRGLVKLPMT